MADDYGTRYTDARLRDVKRRLDEVYRQAAREIELKTQDFWRRHRIKDQIYRAQVARGQLDKEDYQAWMRGQVFQGEQWKAKAEQIARTMTDADKIAQRIVDGEKTNIFATNANFLGYSLEKDLKADIGFGLYDSATVARLIKDEPDLLPTISPEKILEGEDVQWYQKIVTNSVTQGIIQGESIQQIFERIALTCADRAENAAMRDARTAYTGAQNAGRVEAMRQSQKLGIKVKKLWIATFDFKTRDTHRKLDGQTAEVDADFYVDGERIAYPGDPTAEPALVYNCRCTLGYNYPEYPSSLDRVDNITGENVGSMTYKQWYEWKGGLTAEKAARSTKTSSPVSPLVQNDLGKAIGTNHSTKMSGMLGKADQAIQDVWNQYASGIKVDDIHSNGRAFYSHTTKGITFNVDQAARGDAYYAPYAVVYHEAGHNIDALAIMRLNGGSGATFFSHEYKNGLFAQTLEKETKQHLMNHFKTNISKFYPKLDARTIRFTSPTSRAIIQLAKDYENGMINIDQVLANDTVRNGLYGLVRKDVERSFCDVVNSQLSKRERGDLSDMFEPTITSIDAPFGLGHRAQEPTYWYNQQNRSAEAFAEMFSAEVGNRSSLQTIRHYLTSKVINRLRAFFCGGDASWLMCALRTILKPFSRRCAPGQCAG